MLKVIPLVPLCQTPGEGSSRVGQRAPTSRRLPGGFDHNSKLDGKKPGWHECEVKYQATVSTMKNPSTPQGGELCEPEIAASLTPWMSKHRMEHHLKKLVRRNNNNQICAQVDTALRKGLAAYRFGLKVRLAEKLTLGEGI